MTFQSSFSRIVSLLLILSLPLALAAQDAAITGDMEAGKTLFRNQCATCHNKTMVSDMTGPALAGVQERWAEFPREDLYAWIRNSQALVSTGHPRATQIYNEWNGAVMNSFPNLTEQEIENILAYIDGVVAGAIDQPASTSVVGDPELPKEEPNNVPLFIALAFILAILAVVLARILSNLNFIIQAREGEAPARRKTLVDILTSKGVVGFVIFALVVLGGYTTVNNAISLGRQQGYEPEQPIKFSHATHAGLQKIDCQYCHDAARRSKHSNIPAANTCMNCHTAIKVGSQYGTAELTKIYASVGYDPSTDTYIENYDQKSRDEIEEIYKKWIADTYVQETGGLDRKGERLIEEQWDGIVAALTNEASSDDKIYGPIEWVRIHNLPDHVYFNHSQHVAVGQLECQTCHGPVEEMAEVYQYSPLSMGWCINCHRQTEVKFADNAYYDSYTRYHEELASGERKAVTVEDIGGLECQKCHY